MTDDSYNESRVGEIKKSAEKAFKDLPETEVDSAKAMRSQLLEWLVQMDSDYRDARNLANDEMANIAANAAEAYAASQKHNALKKALGNLSDDEQLNMMRYILRAVFGVYSKGASLMTRANENHPWDSTGFHIDAGCNGVFAKVGSRPYQPIGFDDGEKYIGTEGSKTLWSREFAFALMLPYPPPFEIESVEVDTDRVSDEVSLSDKERELIQEAIDAFDEDIAKHSKAESKEERSKVEEFMRNTTLKLMRLRIPRLDKKLDEVSEEHPEVGSDFRNSNIVELFLAMREFLSLKLEDDAMRRDIEATQIRIKSSEEAERGLITQLIEKLASEIPKEGDRPNSDNIQSIVTEVEIAFPKVKEITSEMVGKSDVTEAAKAVMVFLQRELDNLDSKEEPPSGDPELKS